MLNINILYVIVYSLINVYLINGIINKLAELYCLCHVFKQILIQKIIEHTLKVIRTFDTQQLC